MVLVAGLITAITTTGNTWAEQAKYVGSNVCADCHEEEYKSYSSYAKKAHSFEAIEKMKRHLTSQEVKNCYGCHTTGYGMPGGFVDEKTTPDLKNVGCEVCHGPGSIHVETEDAEDILGTVDKIKGVCNKCHTSERVEAFSFRPLLHGGAH
ncbi:MAG: cytochrome C [Thermodesulfatator sp.]|nr:MAG: cytochrome C [Thermodesulfatator sp.]